MKSHARHFSISIITSPSAWGGMEGHTVELACSLDAMGHDVTIFEVGSDFYGSERFGKKGSINVITLDIPSLRNSGLLNSFRILHKLNGDICIFPKGGIDEGSWQMDLIARLLFSRYITIEHLDPQPMPPKSSKHHIGGLVPGVGMWWYKKRIINFLRSVWPNRIVCVSDTIRQRLIEDHRYPAHKVNTIKNGVDTNIFKPNSEYREAFRNTLGISQDAFVFGAIGRLSPVKGFAIALEFFEKLISSAFDRELYFVLVGNGPDRDGLKSFADDSAFNNKVKMISGTDKPWEVYPAFDVFLMPSRNEGLPLSLLESMACGCCPIAMGVGGIPEVITSSNLGWLIQPNDGNGFFAAMETSSKIDPERLREIGKNAREHVENKFEAKKQFMALTELIEVECRNI